MEHGRHQRPAGWVSALAGLEAGMVAVLFMLLWLALTSRLYRRSMWTTINLMASLFYGEAAIEPRFGWKSLSGIAVYLLLYSALGALFALVVRGWGTRPRAILLGIAFGIVWYLLSFKLLWKTLDPWLALYTHDRPMLAGHVLYGALLGRLPRYVQRLWNEPSRAVSTPIETGETGTPPGNFS